MNDFLTAVTFIIGGLAVVTAASIGIVCVVSEYDAKTMRELGYEAKRVRTDCFAKYEGRWLLCTAVAKNQVQVVN